MSEAMSNEGRRQAYLAAMGVSLWTSRADLAGALPSQPLAFESYLAFESEVQPELSAESDVSHSAATPHVYEQSAPPQAPVPASQGRGQRGGIESEADYFHGGISEEEAAAAFYDDIPFEELSAVPPQRNVPPSVSPAVQQQRVAPVLEVKPEPKPAAVTDVAKPQAPKDAPRFNFLLKNYEDWRVIIALNGVPDLTNREHILLGQIEAALGLDGLASAIHFNFPIINNPGIPHDTKAAIDAVTGFMLRHKASPSRVLLLGDDLLPFIQPAIGRAHIAVGARLSRLLDTPLLKRDLWQSLSAVKV